MQPIHLFVPTFRVDEVLGEIRECLEKGWTGLGFKTVAFEQAWRKWSTLRDPARFEPWFDRILVNTCRDRLRSGRRQASDISGAVAASAGDPFTQAHDRDLLANAIARLGRTCN